MRICGLATLPALAIGLALGVQAQEIVGSGEQPDGFRLLQTDIAILDSDEPRTDLDCDVEPLDPKLEYDLTFQAGYVARIPLSELAGNGNRLRVLFRIRPADGSGEPVFFRKSFTVPRIEEDAEGSAPLPGKYRLGPGKYEVDWLMRDRSERVCAHSWKIDAEGPDVIESLAAAPNRHEIAAFQEEPFWTDPPIRRSRGPLLHVKLLVSFSPVELAKVSLSEYDQRSVVSMIRALSREPDIGEFTVIAYNAHEERVIYEAERVSSIDFPALGEAVRSSRSGVVDIEQLQDKKSGEKFLAELFDEHLDASSNEGVDAVVFLGPKVTFERNPSYPLMTSSRSLQAPIFYFIYNRSPRSYPWRDAVSSGLRALNATEYDVTTAKQFGSSLRRMIAALKPAQTTADSE